MNRIFLPLLALAGFAQAAVAQTTYLEIGYKSLTEVESLAAQYGLPQALFNPVTSVAAYRMTYPMPFLGDTILVSGAVFEPVDLAADCPNPVHLYAHGTVFERENTPSFLNYEGELGFLMAGLGFTVVMPDYVGLGTDEAHLHPYVHAESEADAGVFMLDALFGGSPAGAGLHDASQIFLSGYSQGGHAAAAIHRLIEAERPEYAVVAAAPGSGPYDISGTQFPWTFADDSYSNPAYLAYVALAWQSVYGNLYTDLSDYFQEPYASDLTSLFDGATSGAEINAALPVLTADFAQPGLLATLLEPGNPFLLAAENNDVHAWAPQAPTRLYYCTEDEQVFYENALVAESAMQSAGAADVQALNLGAFDHTGCAGQAIFGAALWFSQLAAVCEPSLARELANASQPLSPNPASNRALWPSLGPDDAWEAFTAMGKRMGAGSGPEIAVGDWPVGTYILRAGGLTQRLVVGH